MTDTASLAPIERGVVYPLAEFMRRTGWGRHAVRQARRQGLKVRYRANRGYVVGDDFLRYVAGDDQDEAQE